MYACKDEDVAMLLLALRTLAEMKVAVVKVKMVEGDWAEVVVAQVSVLHGCVITVIVDMFLFQPVNVMTVLHSVKAFDQMYMFCIHTYIHGWGQSWCEVRPQICTSK